MLRRRSIRPHHSNADINRSPTISRRHPNLRADRAWPALGRPAKRVPCSKSARCLRTTRSTRPRSERFCRDPEESSMVKGA
eukprot:scaffold16214_cov109-Isochrysis_galbana.AAC.8